MEENKTWSSIFGAATYKRDLSNFNACFTDFVFPHIINPIFGDG